MKSFWTNLSFLALLFFAACGKEKTTAPANTAPTNLVVNAVVSNDNSGNVSFTATATNAVSYEYDFGNGIYQTSSTGSLTYKYPTSGTYTVTVTAKSSSGQTASKSVQVVIAVTLSLIFSDEFDVAGAPDPAKWNYDLGNNNGWGNNELEYYTNSLENASVSNGTLKITAKREAFGGYQFTSARLLTQDKFAFKYGKVEVKAKLPSGGGTWPAIWMLGSNIASAGWPASGEIDIMEHVGNQQNKIFATLHHPGHSGGNGDGGTTVIPDASTAFHRYGLEWTAATLKFSVDDVPFFTFPNNGTLPFNQNFFLILNVAMGGNFGGAVDPAVNTATMEVDYVRVYQ